MGNKRVVIAMSGGVDSSVAAALLVQQGYNVIGMMLRLWSEPGKESDNRCCTPDAMSQAKRVAALLNIPFYAIDAQAAFYKSVVEYFIKSYIDGNTPNPCLVCNREIRWGYLLEHALAIGGDYLATGHYVRLNQYPDGQFFLKKGVDYTKDQSYVLHVLNQKQFSRSIFPLGEFKKSEVRQMARDMKLPVADKEESQDLCFLAEDDYHSFLKRHIASEITPGEILNSEGEILSRHSGLPFYTIGQRKGLGISSPSPYYVIKKNVQNNTLIIGKNEERNSNELYAEQVNWISGTTPNEHFNANIMVRYRSKAIPCSVHPMEQNRVYVTFNEPIKDITPGQAAVFYDDEICLGGGIII